MNSNDKAESAPERSGKLTDERAATQPAGVVPASSIKNARAELPTEAVRVFLYSPEGKKMLDDAAAMVRVDVAELDKHRSVSVDQLNTPMGITEADSSSAAPSEAWGYCPECGSEEIYHEEGSHKQCANCYQEWFTDIDYTDVVRKHLAEWFAAPSPTGESLSAAIQAESWRMMPSVEVVACVLFKELRPEGLAPGDWESGAVLGKDNYHRTKFQAVAQAVLAALATPRQPEDGKVWKSSGQPTNIDYSEVFSYTAKQVEASLRKPPLSRQTEDGSGLLQQAADLMFNWAGLSDPAEQRKCYARILALASGSSAAAAGWVGMDQRVPEVKPNDCEEFVVAVRRAHNGNTYVFAASYLNGLLLQTTDEDCPEEGTPFTGWFKKTKDHPDYDDCWEPIIDIGSGDEVTHWHAMPAAPTGASK